MDQQQTDSRRDTETLAPGSCPGESGSDSKLPDVGIGGPDTDVEKPNSEVGIGYGSGSGASSGFGATEPIDF